MCVVTGRACALAWPCPRSPYKKPFEERIAKWEQQLSLVSDILEQWMALQRQWMYLEPIFSSDDIMQQLPLEGKRFATVDRMWRKTTEGAKRNPLVLKVRRPRRGQAAPGLAGRHPNMRRCRGLRARASGAPRGRKRASGRCRMRGVAGWHTYPRSCHRRRCAPARSCWTRSWRPTSCWRACRRAWPTTWRPSACPSRASSSCRTTSCCRSCRRPRTPWPCR